jgi:hypothetical protein
MTTSYALDANCDTEAILENLLRAVVVALFFAACTHHSQPTGGADMAFTMDPRAVVSLPEGQLQGSWLGDTIRFENVPYAAPPTGLLRWKPPAAVVNWSGVRDATHVGNICPQVVSGSPAGDEDCLTLRIWKPT